MPLAFKGAADPGLIALPWHLPLEQWPKETIAALPRGISRHVVRFVRLDDRVLAIKETNPRIAKQEFKLLRKLGKLGAPCVVPLAVVTGREDSLGAPLEAALVTAHLQFSLPYRALFSQSLRAETVTRFVDALAVLLVRLHLIGFYWGDVSLSNALFRRDAAEFTAYLVDAETGELHETLTGGQRDYDLDLARTNIVGEMFDLEAQERLHASVDPLAVADRLLTRYAELWDALTEKEAFTSNIPLRIAERVTALNNLGFDIGELDMREADDGKAIIIRPKVVDAGHHARRLMRLTGLDVQENQARRLLNDLDEFRAIASPAGEEESYAAHRWLTTVFEATVRAVPKEFRAKLEPAQIFHEVLDHRWFLSQAAGRDVPMAVAAASYIKHILPGRPDEKAVLGLTLAETSAERTAEMTAELPRLTEEVATREIAPFEGDNTGAWGRDDEGDDDEGDDEPSAPAPVARKTTKRPAPKRVPPGAPADKA
jgi:hypothetical protein